MLADVHACCAVIVPEPPWTRFDAVTMQAKEAVVNHVRDRLELRNIPFDRVYFVNAKKFDQNEHDEMDLLKLVAGQ